jgi:hypothetical protein
LTRLGQCLASRQEHEAVHARVVLLARQREQAPAARDPPGDPRRRPQGRPEPGEDSPRAGEREPVARPLALEEVRIEERMLVAALAGVRIKKSLLLKQQKKLPDFEAEGLFLQMKEDRLQETLRSINQELEEWIKKLQLPF